MRWLYYCDLFFWYLQKASLLLILVWLGRTWWRERRTTEEKKTEN